LNNELPIQSWVEGFTSNYLLFILHEEKRIRYIKDQEDPKEGRHLKRGQLNMTNSPKIGIYKHTLCQHIHYLALFIEKYGFIWILHRP